MLRVLRVAQVVAAGVTWVPAAAAVAARLLPYSVMSAEACLLIRVLSPCLSLLGVNFNQSSSQRRPMRIGSFP